jgi:predicted DNA-binding transcriptional regulator AlpA
MARPAAKSAAALPSNLAPRGLSREAAALYIGVGTTLFDRLVRTRQMPRPTHIGGRRVWDRVKLDQAFEALSGTTPAADPWSEFRV